MSKSIEIVINDKTLTFSHKNDFDNGYIHYLFGDGRFLYWVEVQDGIVLTVASTLLEEAESWEWWDEPFPMEEFEAHTALTPILCETENMLKFQNILIKCW